MSERDGIIDAEYPPMTPTPDTEERLRQAILALPRDRGDETWDTVARRDVLALLSGEEPTQIGATGPTAQASPPDGVALLAATPDSIPPEVDRASYLAGFRDAYRYLVADAAKPPDERKVLLAAAPQPAEPGLGDGTTTDCPLVGVHDHPFRGPHTFTEWYPALARDAEPTTAVAEELVD